MSAETLAVGPSVEIPDIRVWMTPEEAAGAMAIPVGEVDRQLDHGELECRVSDEGELQVLVGLPKRAAAPAVSVTAVEPAEVPAPIERLTAAPAAVSIGDTMLPLVHAMRRTQFDNEARKARQSARFAWAAAAAILLAAGGTTTLSVTAAARAKAMAASATAKVQDNDSARQAGDAEKSALIADKATLAAAHETLSQANADLAAKLLAVSTERDQLKGQLGQANVALHKAEEQLVVERNVEDQLINAALATHSTKGQSKNQVVADTSN